MPSDTTICQGTTKSGRRCSRAAGDGGYCYQHRPAAATEAAALTEKQRRFVEAYMGVAAGNATEAARLAGYDGDDCSLRAIASQNLTKLNIREAIESRIDADPLVATRFDRQRFWSLVMAGRELDGDKPAQMRDRLKASELLARSQGDFVERVEHTGAGGGPIETEHRGALEFTDETRLEIAQILHDVGALNTRAARGTQAADDAED